jgi:hypothetical protein
MALLALLNRLAEIAGDLLRWLDARRQAKAARAEMAARQLKELVDAMDKTRLARARVDELARDPDRLHADDGYRRD